MCVVKCSSCAALKLKPAYPLFFHAASRTSQIMTVLFDKEVIYQVANKGFIDSDEL